MLLMAANPRQPRTHNSCTLNLNSGRQAYIKVQKRCSKHDLDSKGHVYDIPLVLSSHPLATGFSCCEAHTPLVHPSALEASVVYMVFSGSSIS